MRMRPLVGVSSPAINGREDCGFGINIGYSEAYEGYTMLTLPDDARQEMIDYYAQNYAGTNEPSVNQDVLFSFTSSML